MTTLSLRLSAVLVCALWGASAWAQSATRYSFSPAASPGVCVQVPTGIGREGSAIGLASCNAGVGQVFTSASNGKLQSNLAVSTGEILCLNAPARPGAATVSVCDLGSNAQRWSLESVSSSPPVFKLRNAQGQYLLARGTQIEVGTPSGNEDQWRANLLPPIASPALGPTPASAPIASPPAANVVAAQCADTTLGQAFIDIFGRAPNGSGTSGECNKALYANGAWQQNPIYRDPIVARIGSPAVNYLTTLTIETIVRNATVSVPTPTPAPPATPIAVGRQPPSPVPSTPCRDPWVSAAVAEILKRPASGRADLEECDITRYGQGRWSSYDDLYNKVRAAYSICLDPWVTAAILKVHSRAPNGRGTMGECDPQRYNQSRWSSYPELVQHVSGAIRAMPLSQAIARFEAGIWIGGQPGSLATLLKLGQSGDAIYLGWEAAPQIDQQAILQIELVRTLGGSAQSMGSAHIASKRLEMRLPANSPVGQYQLRISSPAFSGQLLSSHFTIGETIKAFSRHAIGQCLGINQGLGLDSCNAANSQWGYSEREQKLFRWGLCAEAAAGGGRIQLKECQATPDQQWRWMPNGEFRSPTGLCLDIEGGGTSVGSAVIAYNCQGSSNQLWARTQPIPAPSIPPTVPTPVPSSGFATALERVNRAGIDFAFAPLPPEQFNAVTQPGNVALPALDFGIRLSGGASSSDLANAIINFELKAEDGKVVAKDLKRRASFEAFVQYLGIDPSIASGKYQIVAKTRVAGQDLELRSKPVEIIARSIPRPDPAPATPQRITLEPSEAAAAMQSKLSDLANTLSELVGVMNALSEELETPEIRDAGNAMSAIYGIVFDGGFPLSLESLKNGGLTLDTELVSASKQSESIFVQTQIEPRDAVQRKQTPNSSYHPSKDARLMMETYRLRRLLQNSYSVGSLLAFNEQRDPPRADANLRRLAEVYRQQLAISGAMRAEQLAHAIELQRTLKNSAANIEFGLDVYSVGSAAGGPLIELLVGDLVTLEISVTLIQNLLGYASTRLPAEITSWRVDLPTQMKVGDVVIPKYLLRPLGAAHTVGTASSIFATAADISFAVADKVIEIHCRRWLANKSKYTGQSSRFSEKLCSKADEEMKRLRDYVFVMVTKAIKSYETYFKNFGIDSNDLIGQRASFRSLQPVRFPEVEINGRAGMGANHTAPLRIQSEKPGVVSAIAAHGEGGRWRMQANNAGTTVIHSHLVQPVLRSALITPIKPELRNSITVQPRNSNDPPAVVPPPPPPAVPRPIITPPRPDRPAGGSEEITVRIIFCNYRGQGPNTGFIGFQDGICHSNAPR
jgi:hypothetical protein